MNTDFCVGCNSSNNMPSCGVAKIATKIKLNDFLNNNFDYSVIYPVCPKNALNIINGRISISNECNECNLCVFSCDHNNSQPTILIDDCKVLENLFLTNTILKLQLDLPIAIEVKADGNYREKRIDIAIQKDNKVYLIKILSNKNRLNYYLRSYTDIVNDISSIYPNYIFSPIILTSQKVFDTITENSEYCFTLRTLIELIEGE